MVKNGRYLEDFERQLGQNTPLNVEENYKIYEAMYHEAKELGIFPLRDPLDGIEDDIRLARILNRVRETS